MRNSFVVITLLVQAVLFAQHKQKTDKADSLQIFLKEKQRKIDSLKKLNFIDMNYEYLDSNFKIKIDKKKFKKIIYEEPRVVENYKDSLMAILYYELKDYDAVNIAFHRILFKWEKLGFYIWESTEDTKEIGKQLGFKHPYRFYKFLKDTDVENSKKTELLIRLKSKLIKKINDTIDIKPYDKFLKYAFRHNPERIKFKKEYLKKHSKSKN